MNEETPADGLFDQMHGTEESCPRNDGKAHEPDFNNVSIESDGGTVYVDVTCKYCRRSGCLGRLDKIIENVSW